MARYKTSSLAAYPVFFANSFPKSGTHLLTQVLEGFTHVGPVVLSGLPAIVTYEGDTGRQRSEHEIVRELERLLPGDISYGHVHALPRVVSFLCRQGVAPYFILRDPRDVVVSHAHYVTDMATGHIHHYYYHEALSNFGERLDASISGISEIEWLSMEKRGRYESVEQNGLPLPDIRARFEPYMGWLDLPQILVLHFEDFVTQPKATISRVYDHAVKREFKSSVSRDAAVQILSEGIDPKRSPTFRSGRVGGWRSAFTETHKTHFKDITGDLLIRLGYEQDNDW